MLCSTEELLQKNLALSNTWQRYQAVPSFESFVELAVSINSFTEFLIDKGITALHHASHQLEQVALTLFSQEVAHPLPRDAMHDLNERVLALGRLTTTHASASAGIEERRHDQQAAVADLRVGQTWLVGHDEAAWASLQAQLGYFGMSAEFISWDRPLPDSAGIAPLLLLDMSSLPPAEWRARVQALRERFAMGQLICLGVRAHFDLLQEALRGGCDGCLLEGTPSHVVVERILELNERHEQEAYRVL